MSTAANGRLLDEMGSVENHRGDSDSGPELSLVIPFYNTGAALLAQTIGGAIAVLSPAGISFEIVAVSDGSTDGSEEGVKPFLSDSVRLIAFPRNRGKGRAVRQGLILGRGKYLGFIDSDGDIPVETLVDFVGVTRSHAPDIIVGSKRHPSSEVFYPGVRRIYSSVYQFVTRAMFGLQVRDTQTGIKLLRRDVAEAVVPLMHEDGFAFDVELLALAQYMGYREIIEAPVQIRRRLTTTVSFKAVLSMVRGTLAIGWRLKVRPSYRMRGTHAVRVALPSDGLAGLTSV